MERIDDKQLKPAYEWRVCTASSIHDMREGGVTLAKDIRDEDTKWFQGLRFGSKVHQSVFMMTLASTSHYPFSYFTLPNSKKPYPTVEIRPQSLIALPPVTSIPQECSSFFKLQDITGEVSVRFPGSFLETKIKEAGLNPNIEALKDHIWTSSVLLLATYDPEDYFLMHVFKDEAYQTTRESIGDLRPNIGLVGI